MKHRYLIHLIIVASFASIAIPLMPAATAGTLSKVFPAAEFSYKQPEFWINSQPLKLSDSKGKVVLLDFWTFDCWNCYRSFPWLTKLEQRLTAKGLQVIGIHTPEFEHEKVRENVVKKAAQFGLHHPIMMDNDFIYWRAMKNRYWPAFYIIDKKGLVRAVFFGETHEGDRQAIQIEAIINQLLAEPA